MKEGRARPLEPSWSRAGPKCSVYVVGLHSPPGGRTIHPEECLGKAVFTAEGERIGEVLDVTVYSFSRVKQLLVETVDGVSNIDEELIETIEPDRILLKQRVWRFNE